MAATTTIPVEVTPEASARVEELGMQPEFEKMVEHTKQTVADLQWIEVTLFDDLEEPGAPRIVIAAWRKGPGMENDRTWDSWTDWVIRTFAPDIHCWFGFEVDYRDRHER